MRRYEGVPTGTLLSCLASWQELQYNLEYRANQKASWDRGSSLRDIEQAGQLALDVQDVIEELYLRGEVVFFDSVKEKYITYGQKRTSARNSG